LIDSPTPLWGLFTGPVTRSVWKAYLKNAR